MSVPRPAGSVYSSSRTRRRTWRRDLPGGMNCSTRSVKVTRPTRSLLATAAKASVAATSAASARLVTVVEVNADDALRSTASRTVSSRSSMYCFT